MELREDAVHFHELSRAAREGIRLFLADNNSDRVDLHWWEFSQFCGVWFHLKYAADTPEVFPKGKWATLQHMEELIATAMK